jgi:hypothetical protein
MTPPPGVNNLEVAAHAIRCAKTLGVNTFLQPRDICENPRLKMSFAAQIFNHNVSTTPFVLSLRLTHFLIFISLVWKLKS